MKISHSKLIYFSIFFLYLSCQSPSVIEDPELIRLKDWMTGSFNSSEQAERDSNFFNINLEMVQIWKDRKDAFWLYIEQAAAQTLERPYRQRIYRFSKNDDGSFESAVYTFKKPLRFAGVWKEDDPLSHLTPDSLSERIGCAITLTFKDGIFTGSTFGKKCSSQLRGATYATSEVRIEKKVLTSWDRGFDANDQQVWGAITGPYIFIKVKDYL